MQNRFNHHPLTLSSYNSSKKLELGTLCNPTQIPLTLTPILPNN